MLDLILCVDDDPITLMLCKKVIGKTTFTKKIITAQNGEEALSYFETIKNEFEKSKEERPSLSRCQASWARFGSAKSKSKAAAKAVMMLAPQFELKSRMARRGRLLTGRIEASVIRSIQRPLVSIICRA